jgi:membrane AbrB-like protein
MPDGAMARLRRAPATWSPTVRWTVLIVLSLLFAAGLEQLQLPAALMLGPMAAAILMASAGGAVRIARPIFFGAQGVVGVMIVSFFPSSVLAKILSGWPIFAAGTLSTLIAACLLGWAMARSRVLPGTTAIWGSSPGAATAMTLMSESYGADMRLVAFMQYTRVVACAVVATLVARLIGVSATAPPVDWLSLSSWSGVAAPLAIALAGAIAGVWLRIPGGALLLPMPVGMAAKLAAGVSLTLPTPILAASYAVIGWAIGMRFSTETLAHAARAFPRVLASILALIAVCGGFAAVLVRVAGIDPVTAYLATSPGGADSVAIIAASTRVDIPFVMAMQAARFLLVLIAGPALARFLSRPPAEADQNSS